MKLDKIDIARIKAEEIMTTRLCSLRILAHLEPYHGQQEKIGELINEVQTRWQQYQAIIAPELWAARWYH